MDLFQLRELFSRSGILMCFNGPFSHSIIEEIGIAIRNYLAAENIARMAVQDVFGVYVEMTQNMRNYLTQKNIPATEAGNATIVISKTGEAYVVTSGNVILQKDAEALRRRIDDINAMTPDELKKRLRQQLRADPVPGALGAGIGLMEMAKRTSGRLEYSIRELGGDYAFFTLSVRV